MCVTSEMHHLMDKYLRDLVVGQRKEFLEIQMQYLEDLSPMTLR
jgi:hypothetical protein